MFLKPRVGTSTVWELDAGLSFVHGWYVGPLGALVPCQRLIQIFKGSIRHGKKVEPQLCPISQLRTWFKQENRSFYYAFVHLRVKTKYENEQVAANMMLTNLHLGINHNYCIRIMIRQAEFRGFEIILSSLLRLSWNDELQVVRRGEMVHLCPITCKWPNRLFRTSTFLDPQLLM